MNLNRLLNKIEQYDFSNVDICDKNYAVSSFICDIKNISKSEFLRKKNELEISDKEYSLFIEYMDRLVYKKEPIQYILGKAYIYNEEYIVNKDVLIPRQDTEILIEKAISYIEKYNLKNGLDLCSGSGAIGISVAKNSSLDKISFIDVSNDALAVTKKNILVNNLKKEYSVLCSNLFEKLKKDNIKYDIIMSNPPYIKTKDIDGLSDYVKSEPLIALDGGRDGLFFYNNIIDEARNYLNDNGYIMFEIGYDQMEDIVSIFKKYKEYEILEKVKDFNSNDRVIICRFHKI